MNEFMISFAKVLFMALCLGFGIGWIYSYLSNLFSAMTSSSEKE